MVSVKEVAAELGCHIETIRRLCRNNTISFIRLGKDYRFESIQKVKEELAAYHNKK